MRDLRRISILAILLVVVLRMSIGWQFLYEGLWKINSQDTATPWTAEGYLKNAQGPFRTYFRDLTGDPDELNWLDYDHVAARWDDWHRRFVAHYDLNDRQQRRLDLMLNGSKAFSRPLAEFPAEVSIPSPLDKIVRYDSESKRLIVDGRARLLPRERDQLLSLVAIEQEPSDDDRSKNDVAKAYQKAVNELYQMTSRLSFKERLQVLLKGDPERAGHVLEHRGEVIEAQLGEIQLYKDLLARYEQNRANARQTFQWDHLEKQWNEIQELRARLVGPVKALDDELKREADRLLAPEQWQRGPVRTAPTQMDRIDHLTMWSLTIIGCLLIVGLLTPVSAIAGAGLLMSFYLAMPPWPGVPEAPGPEHSFIINKNLIEAIALLAIAAMPTGRWFGIDAIYGWLFTRLRTGRPARESPPPSPKTEKPKQPEKSEASANAKSDPQKTKPKG